MPNNDHREFATTIQSAQPDAIAPDGSEIRLLSTLDEASMVHCALPAGSTSKAVTHKTVQEIWYVIGGTGEVWRQRGGEQETISVAPGVSLTIPLGTRFQFRTTGGDALQIVIVTIPPWPGEDEAVRVEDHWPTA